jgi:type IV pilus assembly protein PilQ
MKDNRFSKIIISATLFFVLIGCATTHAFKKEADSPVLSAITAVHIEEDRLIIRGNNPFDYTLFNADDPYRVIVEIPDVTTGTFNERIVSDKIGGISEIIPQQIDSPRLIARFEIVLQNPSTLVPEYKDNSLVLTIKKDVSAVVAGPRTVDEGTASERRPVIRLAVDEKTLEKPAQPDGESVKATEINNVDIKKAADAVKVIITGNGNMIPNVFPVNERIVVDIPDVVLKTSIPDQAISPLKSIRAGKHKEKLRLVIDLMEKTNFDVNATGNIIEVSLLAAKEPPAVKQAVNGSARQLSVPVAAAPNGAARPEPVVSPLTEGKYEGKKISLDFQDADIIPIFRLLGDISGYNIVVHPEVKGKITLKLINVPWDQALEVVLRTFSLSRIVDGNIIRIVPTNIVAKELDELSRAKKAASEAGELKTRIFPVNYALLDKLKEAVDKAKIVSSRGSLSLDERGSSIIVNDLEQNLEMIASLIKEIDQEHMQARQVMIEAKIVEINSDYLNEIGISWDTSFQTPGQGSLLLNNIVDFPAAAAVGSGGLFGLGYVSKAANFTLNMQLTAIENSNNGKVLSNPRIMTMNNQEAKITQGRTIYVPTATADKIEFKAIDALLSLTVKPRIAPGGAIFMDLDITKDEPGTPTAGGVDILKNTVKTSVLVNDADTVVIGGIFKKSEIDRVEGIPGLSKLPLVGLLFKRDRDQLTTTEVLIFITPKVVNFADLK